MTGCIWRSREVLFDVITQLVPEEGRVSVLALVATLWGEWAGWIKRVPDNSALTEYLTWTVSYGRRKNFMMMLMMS